MINIVIADDQSIIREGLEFMLKERFNIVTTAENGLAAHEICKENLVDIILMDIKMPIMNGVEATKIIKRDFPNINIIILTTFNDDEYIFEALKNGASGYLLKDATMEKIEEAVIEVYNGGVLIQPNVARKMVDMFSQMTKNHMEIDKRVDELTPREKDIMIYLGKGKSNKEIGQVLFISEGTVKNHITSILNKLDLRDRTQLALFAVKNKIK